MKLLRFAAVLLFSVVMFAGCDQPRNRAVWSPDGNSLALLAGDALRISDAAGNMSPTMIKDADLVSWLPDSKHLLVVTEKKAENWKQVSDVLGTEDSIEVMADAKTFMSQLLAYPGDWDSFCKTDAVEHLERPVEVITYLRDHNLKQLKAKVGSKWSDIESLSCTIYTLQNYELAGSNVSAGATLYRSLNKIADLRTSPTGNAVAITETVDADDDGPFRILVEPIAGGTVVQVTAAAAKYPDWTPDGQSLVYIGVVDSDYDDKNPGLGYVSKVEILDSKKDLLHSLAPAKNLATVLFAGNSRVRCLADGHILFSTRTASFPCTEADIGKQQSLFELDPARIATVIRLVPREVARQMGDLVQCFEVSPDGTRVAIPSQSGRVTVLTLASGELTDVQSKEDKAWQKLILIPQWRSADQLSFASPSEKKEQGWHIADLVLWSTSKKNGLTLSQNWSTEALEGFLREKDKDSAN